MKIHFYYELIKIKNLINTLQENPDDVGCLVSIQKELLGWHFWLENSTKFRKIRLVSLKRLKRLRGNTKSISLSIKKSIEICENQLLDIARLKLWARHIGNSIPHIYYDKNDLRAYAYSTTREELKELSGDIFGKEGKDLELDSFNFATSNGIKTLLNDLTSIMRNGDLTLMGKEIPYLMELKKSDACRKKAQKQSINMNAVQEYILTDESKSLRGGSILSKRMPPSTVEVSRVNEINSHLAITKAKGAHISLIEDNVYCYSFYNGNFLKDLSFLEGFRLPLFVSLNELKNSLDHSLFYPYSLSLRDSDIFSDFLCGRLSIYLFIDWAAFIELASTKNVSMEIDTSEFRLSLQSEDNVCAKSFTFTKAIVEFTSISWAISQACDLYRQGIDLHSKLSRKDNE